MDCWISSLDLKNALIRVSKILASTSLLTLTVANDFKTRAQTWGKLWSPFSLFASTDFLELQGSMSSDMKHFIS